MKFFVVNTFTGYEFKVQKLLEKRIESEEEVKKYFGRIIVPVERVWKMRRGKKVIVEKKLYPGHILVEMEPNDITFRIINSIPGVMRILGTKKRPVALEGEEIDDVLDEISRGSEKLSAEIPFSEGESVKITSGPFAGFIGVVDTVYPNSEKVKVLVTIFGRSTPIELSMTEVKSI